jgi:hypothetical protein
VGVYLLADRVERLRDDFLHLRNHVLVDVEVFIWVELVNYRLEAWKRKLVAILEVPVMLAMLLHRIIRQVHKCVVDICHINAELRRARPQVSFFEKEQVVVLSQTHPDSDVKLPFENKQGSFNVLLDDERVVTDLDSVVFTFLLMLGFGLLTFTV